MLGNLRNAGQTYRPRGNPQEVKTRDFPDPELGKAIPYGVYDIRGNVAGESVGISHDTAEFAVELIRRWWKELGRNRYGRKKRILVTADSGGSNGSRCRLWKVELQNAIGLGNSAVSRWFASYTAKNGCPEPSAGGLEICVGTWLNSKSRGRIERKSL